MNSCLYECQLTHVRIKPRAHAFAYRIFLLAIDLDELPRLHRRVPLFSHNRANLYSFRDADYLPTDEPCVRASPVAGQRQPRPEPTHNPQRAATLKDRVISFLAERNVDVAGGRVVLVTLPRLAGYLFNPVSFYFCYDQTGEPVAALAEVTNTFREIKPYFVPRRRALSGSPEFQQRLPKHFYVSPFSDVDVEFAFALTLPNGRLSVRIDDYTAGERTFTSALTGIRRELTGGRLAWFTFKYPLLTVRVIALIHWQAFRLWLKGVPWFPKATRAADQRELYRPHASIV